MFYWTLIFITLIIGLISIIISLKSRYKNVSQPPIFLSKAINIKVIVHTKHKKSLDKRIFINTILNDLNSPSCNIGFYVPDIQLEFSDDIEKNEYIINFFDKNELRGIFYTDKVLIEEKSFDSITKKPAVDCFRYYINNNERYIALNLHTWSWLKLRYRKYLADIKSKDFSILITEDIKNNVHGFIPDIITLDYTEKFLTNGDSSSPINKQFLYLPYFNKFGYLEALHITDINKIMVELISNKIELKDSQKFIETLSITLRDYNRVDKSNINTIVQKLNHSLSTI